MSNKFLSWLLFIILSLIWGSSFLLMKIGMQQLSPYHVATLRILSAGVVLLPFTAKAFKQIPKEKIGLVILSGLLGSFFPAYLFCIAETKIDSALTGMLNSLTPLLTILVGILFFRLKAGYKKVLGVVVGLIGLIFMIAPNGHIEFINLPYIALVILATLFYAVNVNMVSRHLQGIGSLNIAAIAFSMLVIPCIVILYTTGYFNLPFKNIQILASTGAACLLGIMGTAVASILFYMLVKKAGALFAAMVTYGIPFIAIIWGVIYGEQVTIIQVACLGVILSGVYLENGK